jgi:hypothetical protein
MPDTTLADFDTMTSLEFLAKLGSKPDVLGDSTTNELVATVNAYLDKGDPTEAPPKVSTALTTITLTEDEVTTLRNIPPPDGFADLPPPTEFADSNFPTNTKELIKGIKNNTYTHTQPL